MATQAPSRSRSAGWTVENPAGLWDSGSPSFFQRGKSWRVWKRPKSGIRVSVASWLSIRVSWNLL